MFAQHIGGKSRHGGIGQYAMSTFLSHSLWPTNIVLHVLNIESLDFGINGMLLLNLQCCTFCINQFLSSGPKQDLVYPLPMGQFAAWCHNNNRLLKQMVPQSSYERSPKSINQAASQSVVQQRKGASTAINADKCNYSFTTGGGCKVK